MKGGILMQKEEARRVINKQWGICANLIQVMQYARPGSPAERWLISKYEREQEKLKKLKAAAREEQTA